MNWFSWTRFRKIRNFSSLVHTCTTFVLDKLLYGTQNPCLFSKSIENLNLKCWCPWIRDTMNVFGRRDTMNVFGRTCCVMACPIDERRTDFSFLTNKLSKKICTDLGKYSQFFSEDFIPSGEEHLLLLASNSFIVFFMILTVVCIAPVLLLIPTNIETKTPFETWIQIEVMSNKGFLHLYSFTSHKYYVLAVGAISMVAILIILVAHFFILHELYLHKKRTVTFKTNSYLSISRWQSSGPIRKN